MIQETTIRSTIHRATAARLTCLLWVGCLLATACGGSKGTPPRDARAVGEQSAAAPLATYIPSDMDLVVRVDFRLLRKSPHHKSLVKLLREASLKDPSKRQETESALQYMEKSDVLVAAAQDAEPKPRFSVLFRGNYDEQWVDTFAKTNHWSPESTERGERLYKNETGEYLVELPSKTWAVVEGGDRAKSMRQRGLDLKTKGADAFMHKDVAFLDGAAVSFRFNLDEKTKNKVRASLPGDFQDHFESIRSVGGKVQLTEDLRANIAFRLGSAEEAKKITTWAKGKIAELNSNPMLIAFGLGEVFDAVDIKTRGVLATVDLTLTKNYIDRSLRQLKALANIGNDVAGGDEEPATAEPEATDENGRATP